MFRFISNTISNIEIELEKIKGFMISFEKSNNGLNKKDFDFKKKNVIKFKEYFNFERKASTNLTLENNNEEVDVEMANRKSTMGSVKKLKNKNLWRGRFQYNNESYVVYSKDWLVCFKKLEAKIKEVIDEEKENKSSKLNVNKNILLCDWWDYWYKTFKEVELKYSSKQNYDSVYKTYFKNSNIFQMKVCKITTFDIQNIIDHAKGYGAKNAIKTKLHSCFQKLVDTHILTFNPVKATTTKTNTKRNNPSRKVIDNETLKKVFDFTQNNPKKEYNEFGNFLKFLLYTGMRLGEALALKWSDIDFDNNLISITKSFSNKTRIIDTPKTKTSIRKIPLFSQTKEILNLLNTNDECIFTYYQNKKIDNYIRVVNNNLNIKINFHMFRHTFASNCLAIGINPKTIQKWLGHAKLDMTMNVYADVINELERKDIDKFNKNS